MKYALVTGGSRGIGRAIAIKLASQGLPVVINYRSNQEAAQATLDEIVAAGGQAELLPFDVASPEETEAAIEQWETAHPDDYIAVLVNNAGIRRDNVLIFMQNEEWHKVIDTTLNGFFYLTRRVIKNMLTKRGGRIINITSLSGLNELFGCQGCHHRRYQGIVAGSGCPQGDRQRHCTRLYSHRYDGRTA